MVLTNRERRFSLYAWFTLAANLLVILWGAYVRATGSGAGCGGHWPLCNGVVLPRAPEVETVIEFTHRLSSGLVLILVLGLFLAARRTYPKGSRIRASSSAALVFMVLEALLGAGLVLFELVAGNTSVTRAAAGALHLTNTFFLLATLSLTASWSSWPIVGPRGNPSLARVILIGLGMVGVLLIGVTGAIAALGDTLFPSTSLLVGFQADLDPGANYLLRLRGLHPLIAIGIGLYLIVILRILRSREQSFSVLSAGLLGLVLLQLTAGAINVILLAPLWLQIIHLLLADGLWIGLVVYFDRIVHTEPAVETSAEQGVLPSMPH
ncbi:MAG: COX15/CtaA family protein [Anaerolineales bacterium]